MEDVLVGHYKVQLIPVPYNAHSIIKSSGTKSVIKSDNKTQNFQPMPVMLSFLHNML